MNMNGLFVFDSLQHTKKRKVQLGFDRRCNARPRYLKSSTIIFFEFYLTRCLRTLRASNQLDMKGSAQSNL